MKRVLIITMLGLSGCTGSLFESRAPVQQVFVLATASPAPQGEPLSADVAVSQPSAAPGLDTERIAVLRGQNLLDYYAGAMWGDTAPHIIQYFLVSSLQRTNKFHSITSEQGRASSDYVLDIDLQDFQAEYGASPQPTAHVSLAVSLSRIKDRKLIGNWRISAAIPASDNRLGAVIEAFQAASQQVVAQVGTNVADAIEASRPHLSGS
jgi:cholesterol transport system auxiliary component